MAAGGGPLKYKIKGSAKSPELDADVIAHVTAEQGLTRIAINAQHPAPPDRLVGGGRHFVAWSRRADGQYARLGAL